jgi:hypothetical protein
MSSGFRGIIRRTTVAVAVVAVVVSLGLIAAPAVASGTNSDQNSTALLEIRSQSPEGPTPSEQSVSIAGDLSSLGSADCVAAEPYVFRWTVDGAAGDEITPSPVVGYGQLQFNFSVGGLSVGSHVVEVVAIGGCAGEGDGLTADWTVVVRPSYQNASVSGVARQAGADATTDADLHPVEGVTVALLEADAPADPAVVSTTTGADGSYTLTAPVTTQEEASRHYLIQFTYPDGSVVYWSNASVGVYQSSTSDRDSADYSGPQTWPVNPVSHSYDAVVTAAIPPPSASTTDDSLVCPLGDGASDSEVDTASAEWYGVCATDPSIDDVSVNSDDLGDGFERGGGDPGDSGFGRVVLTTSAGDYYVTADSTTVDGSTTTIQDDDIYLQDAADGGTPYSVTVARTIEGSFARWVVRVKDASGDLADVPFRFEGYLGSDDATTWTGTGASRVSDDDGDYDTPVFAHHVSATSYTWDTPDGSGHPVVTVDDGGELTYTLAAMDYLACMSDDVRDAAMTVATNADTDFGEDLAPEAGAVCPVGWPDVPVVDELRVGVPFDQTFTAPSNELWDWSDGGDMYAYNLPDGLDSEIVDTDDGQPVQIRIFGTPTEDGPYDFSLGASSEANDYYDEVELTGTVLDPVRQSSIDLDASVGDSVANTGVDVTASGLQSGTDYSVTLRSVPQILASGIVTGTLSIGPAVAIPAGLDAGWHSITLHGTWYNGTPFDTVLWFQLDAQGRLLGTSTTAPGDPGSGTSSLAGLPVTGIDPAPSIGLGAGLLALGLLVLGVTTIRRRKRHQA